MKWAWISLGIFLFCIFIFGGALAWSSGDSYSGSGDWSITMTTYVYDEIVEVRGNLTVKSSLYIYNCTIVFNCSSNGEFTLQVSNQGNFYCYDSCITANNYMYKFNINGKTHINESIISYAWNGIQITLSNVIIENSTIFNNYKYGIYIQNCNPKIKRCEIYNNFAGSSYGYGIYCTGVKSSCVISESKIHDNGYGIYMSSSNPKITGCNIYNHSRELILSSSYDVYVSKCTISSSISPGWWYSGDIYLSSSSMNISDTIMFFERKSSGLGWRVGNIFLDTSIINMTNCNITSINRQSSYSFIYSSSFIYTTTMSAFSNIVNITKCKFKFINHGNMWVGFNMQSYYVKRPAKLYIKDSIIYTNSTATCRVFHYYPGLGVINNTAIYINTTSGAGMYLEAWSSVYFLNSKIEMIVLQKDTSAAFFVYSTSSLKMNRSEVKVITTTSHGDSNYYVMGIYASTSIIYANESMINVIGTSNSNYVIRALSIYYSSANLNNCTLYIHGMKYNEGTCIYVERGNLKSTGLILEIDCNQSDISSIESAYSKILLKKLKINMNKSATHHAINVSNTDIQIDNIDASMVSMLSGKVGLYFYDCDYVSIQNSSLKQKDSYAFSMEGCDEIIIKNATINGGKLALIMNSRGRIYDVSFKGDEGINVSMGSNISIINCALEIIDENYVQKSYIYFEGCKIKSSIFIRSDFTILEMVDCSITSDVCFLMKYSSATLKSSEFSISYKWGDLCYSSLYFIDSQKPGVISIADEKSYIYVGWTVSLKILWKDTLNPISNAEVSIHGGDFSKTYAADANGLVKDIVLYEYCNAKSGKMKYNPYRVTYHTMTSYINVTSTGTKKVMFSDLSAPEVYLIYPYQNFTTNIHVLDITCRIIENDSGIYMAYVEIHGVKTLFIGGVNDVYYARITLLEGENSIKIVAENYAGGKSEIEIKVICDLTNPFIRILSKNITNSPRYIIIGETEMGSVVWIDGIYANIDENGTFSAEIMLEEGENEIIIDVIDYAKNRNSTKYIVILDTIPPYLKVTSPENWTYTTDDSIYIKGKVNCSRLTINGENISFSERFNYKLSLKDGINAIEIIAYDDAGNTAKEVLYVVRDINVTIEIYSPSDGGVYNTRNVVICGKTEIGVVLTVNGIEIPINSEGIFNFTFTLNEGRNDLKIEAYDSLDNYEIIEITVYIDTTPPYLKMYEDIDGMTVKTRTLNISGETDAERIKVNGEEKTVKGKKFEFTIELNEGMNEIIIETMDDVGNKRVMKLFVYCDLTPPTIQIVAPKSGDVIKDEVVEIIGITEKGASVCVEDVETIADGNGIFRVLVHLSPGKNEIEISCTDNAGNTNSTLISVRRISEEKALDIIPIAYFIGITTIIFILTFSMVYYIFGRWKK